MTNNTNTARPIVKSAYPAFYQHYTYHRKKADRLTYNYAQLDDYIIRHWADKSMQQIADETNEYYNRVVYRVDVLKTLGLIKRKNKPTGYKSLVQERDILLAKLIGLQVKINELDAA
jgi:hypothetical protein